MLLCESFVSVVVVVVFGPSVYIGYRLFKVLAYYDILSWLSEETFVVSSSSAEK